MRSPRISVTAFEGFIWKWRPNNPEVLAFHLFVSTSFNLVAAAWYSSRSSSDSSSAQALTGQILQPQRLFASKNSKRNDRGWCTTNTEYLFRVPRKKNGKTMKNSCRNRCRYGKSHRFPYEGRLLPPVPQTPRVCSPRRKPGPLLKVFSTSKGIPRIPRIRPMLDFEALQPRRKTVHLLASHFFSVSSGLVSVTVHVFFDPSYKAQDHHGAHQDLVCTDTSTTLPVIGCFVKLQRNGTLLWNTRVKNWCY